MPAKVIKSGSSFPPHKAKKKKKPPVHKPPDLLHKKIRPPRKKSKRDYEREAYRAAGALDALPRLRHTPTNLERSLTAAGVDSRIAKHLSSREQALMEADLSSLGIQPGKTAGTLPELQTGKWLLTNGYHYGGAGYNYSGMGFGFQCPLVGGRGGGGGGTVADWFLGPDISNTPKGVAIFVDGLYYHSKPQQAKNDAARRLATRAAGYQVAVITDLETNQPGRLDFRMKNIINGVYE